MDNGKSIGSQSALDILLDKNNTDSVYLCDSTGKLVRWEQIAVVPMDSRLYVILKPIDKIKGIADDEVVVFRARDDGQGDCYLKEETDDVIARKVFGEYQKLLLAHVNESDSSDIPPK